MDHTIRPVRTEDAEKLVDYMRELTSEPDVNLPWTPGEFKMTVEEEREFLQKYIEDDRARWLIAEANGEIIGTCEVKAYSRSALRHMAVLGMSVRKGYRGKRIGDSLMREILTWARSAEGLHRVELWVFGRNFPAIRLYLNHGFKIEGKRTHAIYKDGEYLDDYLMGLIL
jgi:RimJ/RimL family protein N-acetyltransferase